MGKIDEAEDGAKPDTIKRKFDSEPAIRHLRSIHFALMLVAMGMVVVYLTRDSTEDEFLAKGNALLDLIDRVKSDLNRQEFYLTFAPDSPCTITDESGSPVDLPLVLSDMDAPAWAHRSESLQAIIRFEESFATVESGIVFLHNVYVFCESKDQKFRRVRLDLLRSDLRDTASFISPRSTQKDGAQAIRSSYSYLTYADTRVRVPYSSEHKKELTNDLWNLIHKNSEDFHLSDAITSETLQQIRLCLDGILRSTYKTDLSLHPFDGALPHDQLNVNGIAWVEFMKSNGVLGLRGLREYIARHHKGFKEALKVLGTEIPPLVAFWLGWIVLASVIIFFCAQLSGLLRKLHKHGIQGSLESDVPWVGIYEGYFSCLVCFLPLVFPVSLSLYLQVHTDVIADFGSAYSYFMYLVIIALAIATCRACYLVHLMRIRHDIHPSHPAVFLLTWLKHSRQGPPSAPRPPSH